MTQTPTTNPFTVRISRTIRAPRERVFEAWVNPELRKKWWHHGLRLSVCEIDARVGGRYRMIQIGGCPEEIEPDPNYEWIMDGEFLEIVRPSRIVFTWNVNHKPPITNNRVTVELREVPGGTEITLTHEGLTTKEHRDGTHEGWSSLLDSIGKLLESA